MRNSDKGFAFGQREVFNDLDCDVIVRDDHLIGEQIYAQLISHADLGTNARQIVQAEGRTTFFVNLNGNCRTVSSFRDPSQEHGEEQSA